MTTHRARTASNIPIDQMPPEVREAVAQEQANGPRAPRKHEARASGWTQGYPDAIKKAMAEMDAEDAKKAEQAARKNTNKEQEH